MPFCESKWQNDLEGQGQCLPFSISAAGIPRCIFGANLMILAQIIEIVKYEDGMLILGQNDIFCGHNVVNFSV